MGAFNWLQAAVRCHRCGHEEMVRRQVPIGWCAWREYSLGDRIVWMTPEQREHAREVTRTRGREFQSLVEIGSEDWRDFAQSTGTWRCPQCCAVGTILAMVRDNVFRSILFTPLMRTLPYGQVLWGQEIDEVLQSPSAGENPG